MFKKPELTDRELALVMDRQTRATREKYYECPICKMEPPFKHPHEHIPPGYRCPRCGTYSIAVVSRIRRIEAIRMLLKERSQRRKTGTSE